MGDRKSPSQSFESYIEQQLRESRERGDFDDLPGRGKPLDLGDDGPDWWLKRKLASEGLSMPLPPALELRGDVDRAMAGLAELRREADVREVVRGLNARIVLMNSHPVVDGPASTLVPFEVDAVVKHWRAVRP